MSRSLLWVALATLLSSAASAQVPVSELATPPADARVFTILSTAGKHGSTREWQLPDGTWMGRMSLNLRGQVWEEDEATKIGPDGTIAEYRLRGSSPTGDVAETFSVANGRATWQSQIDRGEAPYTGAAFYSPAGWNIRAGDVPIEWLVAHPGAETKLLPGGEMHLEKLTTVSVGHGARRQPVTAWAVVGVGAHAVPGVDGRARQGIRVGRRPLVHPGRLRGRPARAGKGPGHRDGGALAPARAHARDRRHPAGGLRRRARVRRRRALSPITRPWWCPRAASWRWGRSPTSRCRPARRSFPARARRWCPGCGTATCTSATTTPARRSWRSA